MIDLIAAFILSTGIGDKANYIKDKKSCTSKSIKSLDIRTEIISGSINTFKVKIDYKIKNTFGSKSGTSFKSLDKYYFEPQFWDYLESIKTHDGNGFTMRHDGKEGHCHKVHIYNIEGSKGSKADALVCPEYPVLGIKTIVIFGKYLGSRYKACLKIK